MLCFYIYIKAWKGETFMLDCVKDCRVDILYKLIDEYNQLEDNSKLDVKKYIKYLEIMDIKCKYLGENNHIHPDGIDNYINSFKIVNSNSYTDRALDSYFNDLRYVFIKIEEVERDVQNLCSLDYCTKVILYINYKFDTNIQYEYDCKLISLTIKKGCESNTYDEEEKIWFRKITPGEYAKESLTFNVLKSDVELVKVENNEGIVEALSVRSFEKKYGDLKYFVFKELYESDSEFINNYDGVTVRTLEIIRPFISLRMLPVVEYVDSFYEKKLAGRYSFKKIVVKNNLKYMTREQVLTHELGHFLHDIIFNNRQIRFSTKEKGNYAKKNYLENFAECFADLIYNRYINDRTKKMFKLLQEVI